LSNCRYHGVRSRQIFRIFASVFGASQRLRLKFVLGTWGFICNGGTGCGAVATRESLTYDNVVAEVRMGESWQGGSNGTCHQCYGRGEGTSVVGEVRVEMWR
jgi:hypothetical protein